MSTAVTAKFTEEWFGQQSQDALARLVARVENVPGRIVEIGAWEGRSTIALANAAFPRSVDSVDTWQGSPGEISAELAGVRDVYHTWRTNVDTATRGNVNERLMGWRDYVPTIDEPVALAFIDAEHTYTEVRDNIAALLPKMAPGGIICGDDVHHPPVQQAVAELLDARNVTVEATLWIWQKPVTSWLQTEFDRMCSEPSDINLHLPVLSRVAARADHVIELGARSGLSTVAFLHGLERSGGRLTSVDISPAPPIGEHARWRFVQGDDTDPAVMDAIPDLCDILFIDTSHAYEHTLWELRNWGSKVRKGGLIICHDTELQRPWDPPCPESDPDFPVKSAIELYVSELGYAWVNFPECWGLGIIEVV